MSYFIKCLKQYTDFKTRAVRSEFWLFTLFCAIILGIMFTLDFFLKTTIQYKENIVGGWLSYFFTLALLLPFSAVMTRRLHDTDKPEIYMILFYIVLLGLGLGFIQIATAFANTHSTGSLILLLATVFIFSFYMIWLIITLCTDSDKRKNKYGECPKINAKEAETVDNSLENQENPVENLQKTVNNTEENVNETVDKSQE